MRDSKNWLSIHHPKGLMVFRPRDNLECPFVLNNTLVHGKLGHSKDQGILSSWSNLFILYGVPSWNQTNLNGFAIRCINHSAIETSYGAPKRTRTFNLLSRKQLLFR